MTVGWTKNNLFFQYYSMGHCVIVMTIYPFTQNVIHWSLLMALFVHLIAMVLETWRIDTFSLIFVPILYQWLFPYKHVYLLLHKGLMHLKVGSDLFVHHFLVRAVVGISHVNIFPSHKAK